MKKQSYLVAALLLIGAMPTMTSCYIGSFGCLNKMLEWNEGMTDNRYISALIAVVIGPIEFMVGGFLDIVIFNTMEFWTGSNPVAATQIVQGQDGRLYAIAPNAEGGYIVTCQQTGQQVEYLFDAQTHTWSLRCEGETMELFTMTAPDEAQVRIPGSDDLMAISLDEQGILALEAAFGSDTMLAAK